MSSGGKQTTGYRYFLGLHMGICAGPVDALLEIRAGDRTAWSGTVTVSGGIDINAPELFGGETREGGLVGRLDVMMGEPTQAPNAYLAQTQGMPQPAYRGIMGVVYRKGQVSANNPYIKPWSLKIRRILQGWRGAAPWYSAKAEIALASGDKAMNPAHIVYECLTNEDWGMGYSSTIVDDGSFRAAADAFHAEGLGLCMQWLRQQSIETFIQSVADHAGAVVGQDRRTGLFVMRLIRGGYTVASLPLFSPANVVAIDDFQRPSVVESVNEVVVRFDELSTGKEGSVTVQNLANIQAQGGVVSQSKAYPGLPTAELAIRTALRDLKTVSTPLAKVRMRANRDAYALLPGDMIRLTWPDLKLVDLPLRVLQVSAGDLTRGEITIEAAEDAFDLPANAYATQPEVGWEDPVSDPAAATTGALIEAPYWLLTRALGAAEAAAVDPLSGYVMAYAARPSADAIAYKLKVFDGTSYQAADTGDWCPSGTLAASIGPTATSATLQLSADLSLVAAGTYAAIGTEWVRIDAVNAAAGTLTIGRGVMDSVPQTHAAGARVLFVDGFEARDTTERLDGATVQAKLITQTPAGNLAEGSAPTLSVVLDQRAARPYPPGRLRINGNAYPASVVADKLTVSWAHRDRLLQNLQGDESGDIGPEAGTTYALRVLDGAAVVASATGLTGTSWESPILPTAAYTVEVWSVRGGLESRQRATHVVNLAGTDLVGWNRKWGARWSGSWGGPAPAALIDVPITIGGTPAAGTVYTVTIDGAPFTYTAASGNTTSDVAAGLAAELAAGGIAVAVSGPVVTVTVPAGTVVTSTTAPAGESATTGTTQTATPAGTATRDTYRVRLDMVTPGTWSTPVGTTYGVRFGASDVALSDYTATADRADADAHYFLLQGMVAAFEASGDSGDNWTGTLDWPNRVAIFQGPPGVDMRMHAVQGSTAVVVNWDRTPATTGAARAQISTVTIGGTGAAGLTYTAVVGGVTFTHNATGGGGINAAAPALAALIDAHATYTATAAGPVVTITGQAGVPFSVSVAVTKTGETATPSVPTTDAPARAQTIEPSATRATANVDARAGGVLVKKLNSPAGTFVTPSKLIWRDGTTTRALDFSAGNAFAATDAVIDDTGMTLGADGNGPYGAAAAFLAGLGVFRAIRWQGDGAPARVISHELPGGPAMVIVASDEAGADRLLRLIWIDGGSNRWGVPMPSSGGAAAADDGAAPFINFWTVTDLNLAPRLNRAGVSYAAFVFGTSNSSAGNVASGAYTGNGSTSGPAQTLGFRPALLIVRAGSGVTAKTVVTGHMLDGKADTHWFLDETGGGPNGTAALVELTDTGFRPIANSVHVNASGQGYIYWALRSDPKVGGPWASDGWAARPVIEFGGKVLAIDTGTRGGIKSAISRLYESADDGATWTLAYEGVRPAAGASGPQFDFVVGGARVAYMIDGESDMTTSGLEYQALRATENSGFISFTGYPKNGSQTVHVRAAHCDGTTITAIGVEPFNGGQPAANLYVYTSTDGLSFTQVGQAQQSGSDPNVLSGSGTGTFVSSTFRYHASLRKVGSRWFLIGDTAIYYTDTANATTGWLRCPTGLNEGASNPPPAIVGFEQVGSKLVAWKANVGVGADSLNVSYSSDNGATWTALRPSPLTSAVDRLGIGWVFGGTLHVVEQHSGDILRCTDPAGTWTRTTPTGVKYIKRVLVTASSVLVSDQPAGAAMTIRRSTDGVTFASTTGI